MRRRISGLSMLLMLLAACATGVTSFSGDDDAGAILRPDEAGTGGASSGSSSSSSSGEPSSSSSSGASTADASADATPVFDAGPPIEWSDGACNGCAPPVGELTLTETVGDRVSGEFRQLEEKVFRLVTGAPPCKLSGSPFFTQSFHGYVRVNNASAVDRRVELHVEKLTGEVALSVVVAAYPHPPDNSEATRVACLTGAESICLGDYDYAACLKGSNAPLLPAGKSMWVYVGNFSADEDVRSFVLHARTLTP